MPIVCAAVRSAGFLPRAQDRVKQLEREDETEKHRLRRAIAELEGKLSKASDDLEEAQSPMRNLMVRQYIIHHDK